MRLSMARRGGVPTVVHDLYRRRHRFAGPPMASPRRRFWSGWRPVDPLPAGRVAGATKGAVVLRLFMRVADGGIAQLWGRDRNG